MRKKYKKIVHYLVYSMMVAGMCVFGVSLFDAFIYGSEIPRQYLFRSFLIFPIVTVVLFLIISIRDWK